MIIRRIVDTHLEYVKDKSTSFEIIGALQSIFERKSIESVVFAEEAVVDEMWRR